MNTKIWKGNGKEKITVTKYDEESGKVNDKTEYKNTSKAKVYNKVKTEKDGTIETTNTKLNKVSKKKHTKKTIIKPDGETHNEDIYFDANGNITQDVEIINHSVDSN